MNSRRRSGVLLPVSALPSPHGIGDFGPAATGFIDHLRCARMGIWQVLPLHPAGPDGSPYYANSSFAGNPLLISLSALADQDLISGEECRSAALPSGQVSYGEAGRIRKLLLGRAVERVLREGYRGDVDEFAARNSEWLSDYALFSILKERHNDLPWNLWDRPYRLRDISSLKEAEWRYRDKIQEIEVIQWLFNRQWDALRSHAGSNGIQLLGDMPIYPTHDSADVWAHQHLFCLDADGTPIDVAGVPPDYFSRTGQRWGNPLYRWEEHQQEGFSWWLSRIGRALSLYDLVRIDHFRGLSAYWAIPNEYRTAAGGRWIAAPGEALIDAIRKRFGGDNLIAEDLGVIDQPVRTLMERAQIPGMRVLLFAFGGDTDNPHLPFNHPENAVVYTGTHDNPPVKGWFIDEATVAERSYLKRYAGRDIGKDEVSDLFIRLAFSSVARYAIIPVQDLLNLGSEARMNRPGTQTGNWLWRLHSDWPAEEVQIRLRQYAETYGRVE
ncbi:4-alpha-glucanotransferase [Methanocalculus taiwanensis]|uniref:4-alpha-glucanotransferase n=1 Tax=Methanocalculus taiwanensis TaxID=106207 RepID=A0ABD4TK94_9EURY|nr:4-alpha-glucanotransferase [Methanocalculus taiwanensis]MCQ1539161.1 4-alpha-glucanotransferase [Methanocalculus taiwanensis]